MKTQPTLLNHWHSYSRHHKSVKVHFQNFSSHLILEDFSRTSFLRWLENIPFPVLNFLWSVYVSLVLVPAWSIILHGLDVFNVIFSLSFWFSLFSPSQLFNLLSEDRLSFFVHSNNSCIHPFQLWLLFFSSLNQNFRLLSRWTFSCALFIITIILPVLPGSNSTHLFWTFLGLLCHFVILHLQSIRPSTSWVTLWPHLCCFLLIFLHPILMSQLKTFKQNGLWASLLISSL